MKWKVHELMDGLMPSNIKAFLDLHINVRIAMLTMMVGASLNLVLLCGWLQFVHNKNIQLGAISSIITLTVLYMQHCAMCKL